MNQELIRIVDGIARDKNIEQGAGLHGPRAGDRLGAAQAVQHGGHERVHGQHRPADRRHHRDASTASRSPLTALGRIAAQTAKQVMIQKIREAERGSIYEEYKDREGHDRHRHGRRASRAAR